MVASPFIAGVNLVLNSLAEEKLQASLRCLARHGRFLEIGKFDLSNNSQLGKMGHREIHSLGLSKHDSTTYILP